MCVCLIGIENVRRLTETDLLALLTRPTLLALLDEIQNATCTGKWPVQVATPVLYIWQGAIFGEGPDLTLLRKQSRSYIRGNKRTEWCGGRPLETSACGRLIFCCKAFQCILYLLNLFKI